MPVNVNQSRWEIGLYFDAYDDQMAMATIGLVCESVIRYNMLWMRNVGLDQAPCCLSDAGVRYIDPPGCAFDHPCQKILSAPEILRRKEATCIDICCYIPALLRMRGKAAEAVVAHTVNGRGREISGQYHILVKTARGVHDYTQDLIHGRLARCTADCA